MQSGILTATESCRDYRFTTGVGQKTKLLACIAYEQFLFVDLRDSYFFLRLIRPAAIDPKPNRPRSGSGEAVWGSFWSALAFWSAEAAFWSAVAAPLSAEVALWSAAALAAGAAFWSVPVMVLAGGFCAVVAVLGAAALWSAVVLLGAAVLEAVAF